MITISIPITITITITVTITITTTITRPRRVNRAVVFEPQGLLGLNNLEEDREVL